MGWKAESFFFTYGVKNPVWYQTCMGWRAQVWIQTSLDWRTLFFWHVWAEELRFDIKNLWAEEPQFDIKNDWPNNPVFSLNLVGWRAQVWYQKSMAWRGQSFFLYNDNLWTEEPSLGFKNLQAEGSQFDFSNLWAEESSFSFQNLCAEELRFDFNNLRTEEPSPQPLNPSLGSPAHRFSKTNLDFPPRKSLKRTNLDSSAQRVLNIRSCTKLMQFWCNVQYSARVKWWTFDALSLTRKLHFPCGFTGLYLRWLGAFVKKHFVHHCPFKFDALLVYFASLSKVHHFFNYFWLSFHNSLENSSQFFRFRFLSSLVQHYGFVTCKYLLTGFTYLQ